MDELIKNAIEPSGGLDCSLPYFSWAPGSERVCVDGYFTAQQLRDIADHMDKINETGHPRKPL